MPDGPKKSGRGGARKGAGRKPGSPTTKTRESAIKLSELARSHTMDALKTLIDVCMNSPSDTARITAANALLDRGYGKPQQSMDHSSSDGTLQPTTIVIQAADAKRKG